ncbi:transmembrane protein, putative [Rhizoctonia solani AG-3 Rhs1AP]|uniref:Transmembrane protein, putative n=2 Tax=Rhizoctonia solani AG-3 TaxID=1086053 RepID=X8JN58_9AGAM|nr:transmembrane protein, putative [Rhizoctonia solani AG-3 Rhs1AP]KEP55163.1 putative transmembrane protein [Rhizoctonia solani 123E]
MVNWSDPEVVGKQAAVFAQLLLVLLGLYTWEIFNSLEFDYNLVVNLKKEFKWPMAVYFVCRYSIWVGVIMLIIANNLTYQLNCQVFYTIIQLFGNIAIGTASGLLMVRGIAIWSRDRYVLFGLLFVALGHWTILFLGVISVRSVWNTEVGVCAVTGTSTTLLRLIYGYTMAFDLTVLVVSTAGLLRSGGWQGSGLWKLLFRDGIVYFIVAFAGNAVAAVFTILHLNAAMDIMFTVPAAVFSTIVACRTVRRLSEWAHQDVYIHSRSRTIQNGADANVNKKEAQRPAIQITMETYTAQEEDEFYHVGGRDSQAARVDLEAPKYSDDDITLHKSPKDFSTPL